MKRRLTDADKWGDPWFMDLPLVLKALWQYLCDRCDNSGVWPVNTKLAEFEIGESIDWKKALVAFDGRVRVIADGKKWYVTKFLAFQYPGGLKATIPPHRQIIRLLEAHGLPEEVKRTVVEGVLEGASQAPSDTPKDKDQTSLSRGDARGERVDTAGLLAEFGLPNGPNDVTEWRGGLTNIAKCSSADDARAFLRWGLSVCESQKATAAHWRHFRRLAEEWNAYKRNEQRRSA